MCEQAVVRTPSVQNMSLMASGMPSSGPASPLAMRASDAFAMAQRALRRLQHIGVERARLLDRRQMRVGEFDGGEFLLLQPIARGRNGERGQFAHSVSSQAKPEPAGFAGLAAGGVQPPPRRPAE